MCACHCLRTEFKRFSSFKAWPLLKELYGQGFRAPQSKSVFRFMPRTVSDCHFSAARAADCRGAE